MSGKRHLSRIALALMFSFILFSCTAMAAEEQVVPAIVSEENEAVNYDIGEILQGSWEVEGGVFTFTDGEISVSSNGVVMLSGTYEIVEAEKNVYCSLTASDGDVNVALPYEIEKGILHLYNNRGTEMTKVPGSGPEPIIIDSEADNESEGISAEEEPTNEEAIDLLNGKVFYLNGGDDTTLKQIQFNDKQAVISKVTFDGNGRHDSSDENVSCTANDDNIIVKYKNGSEETIPYAIERDNIVLGEGEVKSIEEVKEGIKGHWVLHRKDEILGQATGEEKHIIISDNRLDSESASLAMGGAQGEYYYYGPYSGSYSLTFGGFETDMMHGGDWFWNIIDGKPVILSYDSLCKKEDGELPGKNGYNFDWYYYGESDTEDSDVSYSTNNNVVIDFNDTELIKLVQEKLNEVGHDCGTPDGINGQRTAAAIREFQSQKGLAETSLIDNELLKALGISIEAIPDSAKKQELPQSGELWRNSEIPGIDVGLTIKVNSSDDSKSMCFMIYNIDKQLVAVLFVRGNDSVTTYLPVGTYHIKDGTGDEWHGVKETFGPSGYYEYLTFREDEDTKYDAYLDYGSYELSINVDQISEGATAVGSNSVGWDEVL